MFVIPQFKYDPIRPLKVVRRATIKARKLIVERGVAWAAIFITLLGGWITLIYWFMRVLGY